MNWKNWLKMTKLADQAKPDPIAQTYDTWSRIPNGKASRNIGWTGAGGRPNNDQEIRKGLITKQLARVGGYKPWNSNVMKAVTSGYLREMRKYKGWAPPYNPVSRYDAKSSDKWISDPALRSGVRILDGRGNVVTAKSWGDIHNYLEIPQSPEVAGMLAADEGLAKWDAYNRQVLKSMRDNYIGRTMPQLANAQNPVPVDQYKQEAVRSGLVWEERQRKMLLDMLKREDKRRTQEDERLRRGASM